jgi:hypothetical protein
LQTNDLTSVDLAAFPSLRSATLTLDAAVDLDLRTVFLDFVLFA